MNINDVNNVVLFNQYLDVMRSLSESNNTKTVVLPASTPGGYQDLYEQVTKAMLTASETNVRRTCRRRVAVLVAARPHNGVCIGEAPPSEGLHYRYA